MIKMIENIKSSFWKCFLLFFLIAGASFSIGFSYIGMVSGIEILQVGLWGGIPCGLYMSMMVFAVKDIQKEQNGEIYD